MLCHYNVLYCVKLHSIILGWTEMAKGTCWKKKVWKESKFAFYRLDSSLVQLNISTQTMCQFCFWRNVPGVAASDYSSVLHQFSPDARSLQMAATTENIFVWHDGSYKRIFVGTVLLFEPNPQSLSRVWLNRTWSYWSALWETFSKLQWMMPGPLTAQCPLLLPLGASALCL